MTEMEQKLRAMGADLSWLDRIRKTMPSKSDPEVKAETCGRLTAYWLKPAGSVLELWTVEVSGNPMQAKPYAKVKSKALEMGTALHEGLWCSSCRERFADWAAYEGHLK